MKRRGFLRATSVLTISSLLLSGGAMAYAKKIEPSWVEVNTVSLPMPRLQPAFHGYRIVQISDIHVNTDFMDRARLDGLVRLVNGQRPDLIVITGDFATYGNSPFDAIQALRLLKAPDGVFAVLGNHDHWSRAERVRAQLRLSAVQELNDATHTIVRGNALLHLVGLDDLWPVSDFLAPIWTHKERLLRLVRQLPYTGAALLLVHEPDFADVAASVRRFDLQLSGHSHGGQVRLPLHGPLELPPLAVRYPSGLYHVEDMLLYTNRGLGMMPPLVRFDCRPEVTVFVCLSDQVSAQVGTQALIHRQQPLGAFVPVGESDVQGDQWRIHLQ